MSRQTKQAKRAAHVRWLDKRLRAILSDGRGRTRGTLHRMTEESIWGPFERALKRLVDAGEVTRGPATDRDGWPLYTIVNAPVELSELDDDDDYEED